MIPTLRHIHSQHLTDNHNTTVQRLSINKGLLRHVSSERACNSHSTYVDSEILDVTKIAQTHNEQASTGMFMPPTAMPRL